MAGPIPGTPSNAGVLAPAGFPNQYYFAPTGTVSVNAPVASRATLAAGGCALLAGPIDGFPVSPISFGLQPPVSTIAPQLPQQAARCPSTCALAPQ